MNNLNIPILDRLSNFNNILILGVGGGFDVYCGLPIYFELFGTKNVVLANYSFTKFEDIKKHTNSIFHSQNLVENKGFKTSMSYNPEGFLYEGFKTIYDIEQKIYSINRKGVVPVEQALRKIVTDNKIDCIICVDGGIDSIFHGNEKGCGTILEDTITNTAVKNLNIQTYLVCIGLTTEIEEKVCNHSAFKRISEYYKDDAVFGVCSLTKSMDAFLLFKTMCEYCWTQPGHKKSHISSRIIPAVEGKFEGEVFHNFLMNLYFFFDFDKVLSKNVLVKQLQNTTTFEECVLISRQRKIEEPFTQLVL